jgi:hypothetical protein
MALNIMPSKFGLSTVNPNSKPTVAFDPFKLKFGIPFISVKLADGFLNREIRTAAQAINPSKSKNIMHVSHLHGLGQHTKHPQQHKESQHVVLRL